MPTGDPKEYYCDTCLRVRGELVWMTRVTKAFYGYTCDHCGRGEVINQGNARHYVAERLDLMRKLAEELGIPWAP